MFKMAGPGKDDLTDEHKTAIICKSEQILDVTSPKFNPYDALYSRNEEIPYPNVQVFRNVQEYERIIKTKETQIKTALDPMARKSSSGATTDLNLEYRTEGAAPKAMKTDDYKVKVHKKVKQNILTRMQKLSLNGPLNLLQKCLLEKHHVRVWTRSAVSVRGICKGYIVAFDKHFNMAMIDVDEVFKNPYLNKKRLRKKKEFSATTQSLFSGSYRLSEPTGDDSKLESKSKCTKGQTSSYSSESARSTDTLLNPVLLCESVWLGLRPEQLSYRHVNQLFIRGDNVVCVNIVQR